MTDLLKPDAALLHRYVDEFAFRLNEGNVAHHTLTRLESFVAGPAAKRLPYARVIGGKNRSLRRCWTQSPTRFWPIGRNRKRNPPDGARGALRRSQEAAMRSLDLFSCIGWPR